MNCDKESLMLPCFSHGVPFTVKWILRAAIATVRFGIDQRSDFLSDFRARQIRTQITWEILSANCHEVTVVPPHARRWLRHSQCRSR